MINPDLIIVLVTCARGDAEKIASIVLDEKLAACVSVIPAKSFFFWKEKYCREEEDLLILKSTGDRYADLEQRLKTIHPYETPEIIAVKALAVSREYEKWVVEQTAVGPADKIKDKMQ